MPIAYEVYPQDRFIYIQASGNLTNEAVMSFASQFLADPSIDGGSRILLDCLRVSSVEISSETIEWVLELENTPPAREKLAGSMLGILIREPLGWAIAEEYEKRAKRPVIVFYNPETAFSYMGLANVGCIGAPTRPLPRQAKSSQTSRLKKRSQEAWPAQLLRPILDPSK
jgi:hypothetical protein